MYAFGSVHYLSIAKQVFNVCLLKYHLPCQTRVISVINSKFEQYFDILLKYVNEMYHFLLLLFFILSDFLFAMHVYHAIPLQAIQIHA